MSYTHDTQKYDIIVQCYRATLKELTDRRARIPEDALTPEVQYHIDILLEHIEHEIKRYYYDVLDADQQRILISDIKKDITKAAELLTSYEWFTPFLPLECRRIPFFMKKCIDKNI